MAEPVRHRKTKEAATDMFDLQPPRHIPTLPFATEMDCPRYVRFPPDCNRKGHRGTSQTRQHRTAAPKICTLQLLI
jgi:hypothetical protein